MCEAPNKVPDTFLTPFSLGPVKLVPIEEIQREVDRIKRLRSGLRLSYSSIAVVAPLLDRVDRLEVEVDPGLVLPHDAHGTTPAPGRRSASCTIPLVPDPAAVLVANGRFRWNAELADRAASAPVLLAADGGANALAELGLRPNAVVGDLDGIAVPLEEGPK